MRKSLLVLATILITAASGDCGAQSASPEANGKWVAYSKTAESITGDVIFTDSEISLANRKFAFGQSRKLQDADLKGAARIVDATGPVIAARLYQTKIPAGAKLLRGNTLCGQAETTWLVAVQFKGPTPGETDLGLAFFSGAGEPPVGAPDQVARSRDLCGTFGYSRP